MSNQKVMDAYYHDELSETSVCDEGAPSRNPPSRSKLPFLTELLLSHQQSVVTPTLSFANPALTEDFPLSTRDADGDSKREIKRGVLFKTTVSRKEGSKVGQTRQRRHFRLTDEALEYENKFNSYVKIKGRSFPLTSIEKVEYDEMLEPTIFHLLFSNFTEVLQAETAEEASDWVEKIVEACSKWYPSLMEEPHDDPSQQHSDPKEKVEGEETECSCAEKQAAGNNKQPLHESGAKVNFDLYESLVAKYDFTSSKLHHVGRRFTCPDVLDRDNVRFEGKQNQMLTVKTRSDFDVDFSMIKYPRHALGVPSEKLFKMDASNMQIMWRRNQHLKFQRSRSLSLHKVVEVREGQNTEMFDKFPFEKVEGQSFSLIYQQEDKRYTHLTSLNLICDHPNAYDLWINELRLKVKGHQQSCTHPRLSSQDNDTTDTTLLWLKQIWSCKSENDELAESAAIKMARKLNPFINEQIAKRIAGYARQSQIESSHGLSLTFGGFVLMFNLLSEYTESVNSLYLLFKKYARSHPRLGMTSQEFKEFLVNECSWKMEACTTGVLHQLMKYHDSYHQAYKKYCAGNRSSDYVSGYKLLSFAGFLSFLRSKDNSAIDPEHETVYQDMTQPLSHYFINSSHNTYLEGDQLKGKSSTEAYVRAFLQGCRCIEIDCWDDTLNAANLKNREPIIYHGFTLTTKLPFRDVIHTIKDYSFSNTNFPVIISIENHCNKTNQVIMAKTFRAIFGDMLLDKDLVELEGRTRLPSPQELQGKIILKGSYKQQEVVKKSGVVHRALTKLTEGSVPPSLSESLSTSLIQSQSHLHEEENVDTEAYSLNLGNEVNFPSWRQFSLKPSEKMQRRVSEVEQGQDNQELEFKGMIEDLSSLIVYAKAISIKPWSWEKQRATSVTQMFSFGEPKAVDLCMKWPKDMLACTERQLVRTYPKGTRFDSSNYDPLPMWRCGVQMGFFRLNGGCGYVLKPAVMRREYPGGGSTPFDPEMQEPHPDVLAVDLQIELLSGQRLCPWKKKRSSVTVTICTYGITHDCAHMEKATHSNVLWPHWKKGKHILSKTLYMPELCLVYFTVEERKLFGQNCIPAVSLQSGIKFIPLRTPGGELIPGSGLFVKIKKEVSRVTIGNKNSGHDLNARQEITKRHLISRQVGFDFEDGAGNATEVDEEGDINEKEDFEVNRSPGKLEGRDSIQRHFSSPALLEHPGVLFNKNNNLTISVEVHEDITAI